MAQDFISMAPSSHPQAATLKLACLCRQVRAHVDISRDDIPLHASICHCNACRHVSGLLCTSLCQLPATLSPLEVNGDTCSYEIGSSRRIVFFCTRCGASIYETNEGTTNIILYTGVLETDPDIVEFTSQCCAKETRDGGLSTWLNIPDCDETDHCILHERASVTDQSRSLENYEQGMDIKASCHCGGVQFIVTLPCEASIQLSSPYPDLLISSHSGPSKNEEDAKWWLRANGTRYLAGTCACRSCRLAAGSEVQTWAFIPKVNMRQMNGDPIEFVMSTMKQHTSSIGVYRNFCGTCGATVFWHNDERPHLIDVSVGLLNARSGGRAEELLEWATERISFQEEAQNKALIAKLNEGLRKRGGRTCEAPDLLNYRKSMIYEFNSAND